MKNNPARTTIHEASSNYSDHESVHYIIDEDDKLIGFVGIHSTQLGPALGGTRMMEYDTELDAIDDVLNLSKAMSYKCALAKLPYGGGKGVIIKRKPYTEGTLKKYAEYVESLNGIFKTGTDVGMSEEDVNFMSNYTSHMLGQTDVDRGDLTTSKSAARGVYHAIKASTKHKFGTTNLKGIKVSIKGVGKLGGELLRLLTEDGAVVTIADVNQLQINKHRRLATNVVLPDEIHKYQADVYSPCALGGEFDETTVNELNCSIIAGGANNQLKSQDIGSFIHEKDILYAPDYVSNAGGLIYVSDELNEDGFRIDRVRKSIQDIEETLEEIFNKSKNSKIPTSQAADEIALERLRRGGSIS